MRRQMPKPLPVTSKVVLFTGGLKEDVSQLELQPGELIGGFNYMEEDGVTHGYTSISGYERTDGRALPSSIEATEEDDTAREAQRTATQEVPGQSPVEGAHIYKTDIYAVRKTSGDPLVSAMYKSTTSGWTGITGALTGGGEYQFVNAAFDLLASHQREKLFFFVNGVDAPSYYDGTQIQTITHANLPTTVYPTTITVFKNRLFLGYPDGRLFFSSVGDPTDFDAATGGAGVIEYNKTITNLQVTPGDTLAVFLDDSVQLLTSLYDLDVTNTSAVATYKFKQDEFSNRSGAYPRTVQRILGKMLYMNDRGLSSMETSDTFGDFEAASLSKNVQKGLLALKGLVSTSIVDREKNQYRVFFSNGLAYFVTFNIEKAVRGITTIIYDHPVLTTSEGLDENGNDFKIFTSDTGYVYKMDSGTSFDGGVIRTRMDTSFYAYGTPSNWKKFYKIVLETTSSKDLTIYGRFTFNYNSAEMPSTTLQTYQALADVGTGIYGISPWGSFTYGIGTIQTPTLYIQGVGNNMSIILTTESAYESPHTIHNAIIDYSVVARLS